MNNVPKMCHLFPLNKHKMNLHIWKLRKSYFEPYSNCILNDFNYFESAMGLTYTYTSIWFDYIWNVYVYKIACMMNKLYIWNPDHLDAPLQRTKMYWIGHCPFINASRSGFNCNCRFIKRRLTSIIFYLLFGRW